VRAFRVAYDGRPFRGFQRQPDVPTVADALLDALRDLGVLDDAGDADEAGVASAGRAVPPGYAAAGRTDAGVSALAQTVAFDAPDWLTPRAFNGRLPPTVRAWAAADAPPDFHATHDATRREYRYHLVAPAAGDPGPAAAAHPAAAVDDGRVRAALDRLAGRHDFRNLTPDDTGTERTVETGASRAGDVLRIRVAAGGFPRQFVRRLVALVRAVGTGAAPPDLVGRALAPEPLAGPAGIGPAPPEPLVLWAVPYGPAVDFEPDREAVAAARAALGERQVAARRAAATTGAIRDGLRERGPDDPDGPRG